MTNLSVRKANDLLLVASVLFFACAVWSFSAQDVLAQQDKSSGGPQGDILAKGFLAALASKDYNEMKKLTPTVETFRTTAPEETAGKTDAEVMELAKPLYDDVDSGFHILVRAAKTYNVDLQKLRFVSEYISNVSPITGANFFAMEIHFEYGKHKGVFTVGTAVVDDKWYIYAIEPESVRALMKLKKK
jgi:hypothetical protein